MAPIPVGLSPKERYLIRLDIILAKYSLILILSLPLYRLCSIFRLFNKYTQVEKAAALFSQNSATLCTVLCMYHIVSCIQSTCVAGGNLVDN